MIKHVGIAMLAFSCLNVFAQQKAFPYFRLAGKITDSAGIALSKATIRLTAGPDTLTTLSGDDGSFLFPRAPAGKVGMLVTMRGYLSFSHFYNVPESQSAMNLPPIILRPDYGELNPVTITGVRPITVTQDTVSYHAAAFSVRDGSDVEDILKRLPGVEVDADGNVIVQGKKIE